MDYTLFQPHVLDYLKDGQTLPDGTVVSGRQWFREAVTEAFCQIAEGYCCEINMAGRRLDEAHELWIDDLRKVGIEDSNDPDHLKQAGFLAYWLRRRIVIAVNHELPQIDGGSAQRDFIRYGNEMCSFLVGFRIVLFFESQKRGGTNREEELNRVNLDSQFLKDVAVLLRHKNLSPHAMYLIYRALFHPVYVPKPDPSNVTILQRPKAV